MSLTSNTLQADMATPLYKTASHTFFLRFETNGEDLVQTKRLI
jgi:hypothetical protein